MNFGQVFLSLGLVEDRFRDDPPSWDQIHGGA
jgi:hypothetical protein